MVQASYEIGKKIYYGDLILDEGVEILNLQYGMDKNSAKGYINIYKNLVQGEQYAWTINGYATKYYIIRILLDNGKETFLNALNALKLHLDYQDNIGHNTMASTKDI